MGTPSGLVPLLAVAESASDFAAYGIVVDDADAVSSNAYVKSSPPGRANHSWADVCDGDSLLSSVKSDDDGDNELRTVWG